jgi:uncharacterized protein
LIPGVLAVAFLYSTVGHAGASGYIAVLTLAGLAPAEVRPAALVLNILAAVVTTAQFARAGHFRRGLFLPFALASVPCAFLGGRFDLPARPFKVLVGLVLLASAARFVLELPERGAAPPPKPVALATGAALGLLSGLTGTGGGIFLTPLLLLAGWAGAKEAAAASAPFILVNSIAGLSGLLASGKSVPGFVAAALLGSAAGAHLGARRFSPPLLKRLLAAVLLVAGLKLVLN